MIDYIKFGIKYLNPSVLLNNTKLDFRDYVNLKTGEVGPFKIAKYKELKFKIYYPTIANPEGITTLEGSLHKFWNGGKHNYNDFGINELNYVLKVLREEFGIKPENCVLRQLEIGVNIVPPVETKNILRYCMLHKTEPFRYVFVRNGGNYRQVQHQRYYVKAYDKAKHCRKLGYKINNEIFRFELKFVKMIDLNKKGIKTLQGLLDVGLNTFVPMLIKEWQNVLFYDYTTLRDITHYDKYRNRDYWIDLNPELFKYHRRAMNSLINSNPNNLRKMIAIAIEKKCKELNTYYPN